VCVCNFSYPQRTAHPPYFHLWPVCNCSVFPHYLINSKIFEKKLLNIKCVFWFSVQLLSETFLILRRLERDMIKNAYWTARKIPVTLVRLMTLEFSRQFWEEYSNAKFHENPSSGGRVVVNGRTDITKLIVIFEILRTRLKMPLFNRAGGVQGCLSPGVCQP